MPTWKERWVFSYIFDYVIIVVFIGGFLALDLVEPYHQHFSLENYTLQYPYAVHERVTAAQAGLIACLFPALVIVIWTMLIDGIYSHRKTPSGRFNGPWTLGERLWQMNCGLLGLLLSVGGAIVITGALKNSTGKPRPDVISRCDPEPGSKDAIPWGLVTSAICRQTDHAILKDGFRSFPSGHSSTSFSGLGFLSFFLAGKLHVMDNRGEVWKTIIVMIPLLAAALVAVSRIMDARHHPFDVITGSMLGVFTAWVAYRQYFPSLSKPELKGRAYPRRSWGTEAEYRNMPPETEMEEGMAGGFDVGAGRRRQMAPRSRAEEFEMVPQRTGTLPPPVSGGQEQRLRDMEYRGASIDMADAAGRMKPGFVRPPSRDSESDLRD